MPNIWRLRQAVDTKFGTNASKKMFLNAEKLQGYSFYFFLVVKGKPTGTKITSPPPPPPSLPSLPRLELNADFTLKDFSFGAVELTKNADPDK